MHSSFHSFIHSFISWSVLRQIHRLLQNQIPTKWDLVLPFQFTVPSHFPEVIQLLLRSVSSFFLQFYLFFYRSFNNVFRRKFLGKMQPIHFFILFYVGCSFGPCLRAIQLYFSHDWSKWSSQSFSNITNDHFSDISNLISEVSNFHHLTKVCSKCSALLVSF
jgi:hypothetical protein